jgi:hypothetical protein
MDYKCKDTYFQFPIRALRVNCRLDEVSRELAYRVIEDAKYCAIAELASDLENDERIDALAESYFKRYGCSDDASFENDDLLHSIAAACTVLKVNLGKLGGGKVDHIRETWTEIMELPGSNVLVRVRADLMSEFRDSWEFRDAAILCGVYAGVGNASFKKLSCDRIRTLAMGFASNQELLDHGVGLLRLSDRQVRISLSNLANRGLFQFASPDKRHNYYSNRLSEQELITELAKVWATKKQNKTNAKREAILAQAQQLLHAEAAAALKRNT